MRFHSQEVNLNQIGKQEKSASPVQSQPERDLDNYMELQTHAIHKLEQQMKKQVSGGADCKPAKCTVVILKCGIYLCCRIRNGSRGCRT